MIKKNGGIFGRNPTYNDVVVEGTLTLKEAQTIDNDLTINGDFTVNGTSTAINTVNLDVDDKNISMGVVTAKVGLVATSDITAGQATVLLASTVGLLAGMTATKTAGTGAFGAGSKIASVDSATQITMDVVHATSGSITFDVGGASDDTADGGGITLKGTTDKLITWVKSKTAWVFNQRVEAPGYMWASTAVITDGTATRTLTASDNGKIIYCTSNSAVTINCATGLGAGFTCKIIQGGDGKVTVAGNGATLASASGFYATNNKYSVIGLISPAADVFLMEGDIETAYILQE